MNKCIDCEKERRCTERRGSHEYCFESKKKTNYSYIRDMSVEEMALFMDKMQLRCLSESCKDCPLHKINPLPHYYCSVKDIKEWLESEVDTQE